tara:strand:+ start:64 stop:465 length:402 start_codon:yes stop_codon:yes gene_type:complete
MLRIWRRRIGLVGIIFQHIEWAFRSFDMLEGNSQRRECNERLSIIKISPELVWAYFYYGRDRIRTSPTGEVETKKSGKGGTECAPLQNKITLIGELLSVFETLSPESQRELLRAALEQKQRESNNEQTVNKRN